MAEFDFYGYLLDRSRADIVGMARDAFKDVFGVMAHDEKCN